MTQATRAAKGIGRERPFPLFHALVSAAEATTCRAKTLGRGRSNVPEDGLPDRVTGRRGLGAELATAVARDQLTVHYQPIVELATGTIASFEALVRWQHPTRGLLGPDTFLPAADALDLHGRLNDLVLAEACRTAGTWPATPRGPVSVAVNIPPWQLTTPGFAANVEQALATSGLPATSLVLELTETAVIGDVTTARRVLRALSALGVEISIDDFGTGYSSMLRLRQLPFDKLKIDREFVRGLPQSRDDLAICTSVVTLADRFGLRCVAEGVENAAQAAALTELGCQFGQGFLWSPAVDEQEALQLLQQVPWNPSGSVLHGPVPSVRDVSEAPDALARIQPQRDDGPAGRAAQDGSAAPLSSSARAPASAGTGLPGGSGTWEPLDGADHEPRAGHRRYRADGAAPAA